MMDNPDYFEIIKTERQNLFQQLALHGLSNSEDNLINFFPFVERLKGTMGDKGRAILKKELGDRYEQTMKEYKAIAIILQIVKAYKNGLESHVIEREDVTSKRFMKYMQASAMIPLTATSMFEVGAILIRHTNLKNLDIPSLYFTLMLPKDKKIEEQRHKKESDKFREDLKESEDKS